MTNQEIATRLHEPVEAGDYFTAYIELFSTDVVAKEPQLAAMGLGEVRGIQVVKDKVTRLGANVIKGKLQDGNDFNLSEICLYKLEDGKIVSEEFIY